MNDELIIGLEILFILHSFNSPLVFLFTRQLFPTAFQSLSMIYSTSSIYLPFTKVITIISSYDNAVIMYFRWVNYFVCWAITHVFLIQSRTITVNSFPSYRDLISNIQYMKICIYLYCIFIFVIYIYLSICI